MKKNAFTLVELLGVIVILGIISVITIPLVKKTILENTEKAYEDQVTSFERAAKNYVASDIFNMSNCKNICTVSLKQLQQEGYLPSGDIINPKTDEKFNMENVVDITYHNEKFSYNYDTDQDKK